MSVVGLPVVEEQDCPACGLRLQRLNPCATARQVREATDSKPPGDRGWFEWSDTPDAPRTWEPHSAGKCAYVAEHPEMRDRLRDRNRPTVRGPLKGR